MTTINQELKTGLENFTGTETWFRHETYKFFTYTEGVQFLVEQAGAYWLVDLILGLQLESFAIKNKSFQLWKLITENNTSELTCKDGNGNAVYSREIQFTNFPLKEINLYLTGCILHLPPKY